MVRVLVVDDSACARTNVNRRFEADREIEAEHRCRGVREDIGRLPPEDGTVFGGCEKGTAGQ